MNQKEERWIEFEACQIEDDEKEPNFDLFGDPDPYELFEFTFPIINNIDGPKDHTLKDDGGDNDPQSNLSVSNQEQQQYQRQHQKEEQIISISLKGFKHEHERIFDSTGLTLWRASKLLCNYLSSNPHIVRNKHVIELGAGLGLCGLLTYYLGAKSVVLTDGDTDVLNELRYNVDENLKRKNHEENDDNSDDDDDDDDKEEEEEEVEVEAIRKKRKKPSEEIVPCYQLLWGKKHTQPFKEQILKSIASDKLDETQPMDGFDVIIASDVIYVEYILDDLFETIVTLLSSSPDAKAYIGYARRAVDIKLVFECAERHGLTWVEPSCDDNNDKSTVEGVYIFSRR